MEAVRKAASEAVDTIRNSPLFRRKFGNRPAAPTEPETPQPLHPESDRTPFVQGVYFQVHAHMCCWLVTLHRVTKLSESWLKLKLHSALAMRICKP